MTSTVNIEIPGVPVPFGRPVSVPDREHEGRTIRVNPQRYRGWRHYAADVLRLRSGRARYTGEVAVTVDVYPDRVRVGIAELDRDDRRRPKHLRGDLDNYGKAVLDALQTSGVIVDDRQAAALTVVFHPEPPPK